MPGYGYGGIAAAAALVLSVGINTPARADVACATVPTLAECVQCGAARYGAEAQQRFCAANWAPGRQQITYAEYQRLINGGWPLPMRSVQPASGTTMPPAR
jgi:hypothetical protein